MVVVIDPSHVGRVPLNWLPVSSMLCNCVILKMTEGRVPVKLLLVRDREVRPVIIPNTEGNFPFIEQLSKDKYRRDVDAPNSVGIGGEKLLDVSWSWLSKGIVPIDPGIVPVNRL
jgi:hypothetical protein